ncbi:hypothetical protein RHMOL_Rhmol03G0105000 [Rhododendron molle]|uniref:Uncharacterized protein n=1 Tax=Rhododendron molle TaxID=49168 RepID=A0ACC0PF85_RHOML|nr:hypothetical protein RHMOL_Rhmol03G0105000 [Rhododendron molle]
MTTTGTAREWLGNGLETALGMALRFLRSYKEFGVPNSISELKKENKNIDLSIPTVRLGETEDVNYEAVTTALRKAIRLNRAIQSTICVFLLNQLRVLQFFLQIINLYISGAINTILTAEHKKELIRYIYLHQNDDGGWGFYIEGHSTMIGSALSFVALRLLGEGPDDGENGAMPKARKWILDNGGATGISS